MNPVTTLLPSSPRYQEDGGYTPLERATRRLNLGSQLADRFARCADDQGDLEAVITADLLSATYTPRNVYWSPDLVNYETGELFGGFGVLQNLVSSRLSPSYVATQSRRQRKRILRELQGTKVLVGCRYRFWTLTLPFIPAKFETVLAVKDRAFALFRKRRLWTENVQGAYIGEEDTIGSETTPFRTHHHVHLHGLILSRYIDEKHEHLISTEWTDCVEKACQEYGVSCNLPRTTNRLMVDVRDVGRYANKKEVTLEKALEEVCKYTVKGSDFLRMKQSELVEVEKALFNRQMIRSYGCFNKRRGGSENREEEANTASNTPSLDTKCIVDGERSGRMTLRERGKEMCEAGRRDEWLEYLATVVTDRIRERRLYLSQKYPLSTFHTLDGSGWQGVSATVRKGGSADVIDLAGYRLQRRSDGERVPVSITDRENALETV